MRPRRLLTVLVLVAGAATSSPALAQAPAVPGPVSPALISFLNSAGTIFRLASHTARPRVSAHAAIRDASKQAPWRPVTATGISLIRLAKATINAPVGTLAWLVSVQPGNGPAPPGGGPAPGTPGGSGTPGAQTSPPASFYVVAVAAANGHFIASAHGYTGPAPAQ